MTKSKKIKLLAVVLVCAIVLPIILASTLASAAEDPYSVASWSDMDQWFEEEIAPVDPNITESSFIVGETVYDPVLTATTNTNGVPEDWLAVPDGLVSYYGEAGKLTTSGAWLDYSGNATTKGSDVDANEEINPRNFTFTADGLKAAIGGYDFSLLMPTLKDSDGNEVENYVYTVEAMFPSGAKGQFGLITGTRGSEITYEGGTFHCYYGPNESNSWYYYHYGESGGRVDAVKISKTADNAIAAPEADKKFTLSVYHCDGMNYFFLNGKYVHSFADKDYYNGAKLSGVGLYFCNSTVVFSDITVKKASTKTEITDAISLLEPTIRYCDVDGSTTGAGSEGLRFMAKVDKTSELYKGLIDGSYSTTNENVKFGMLLIPNDMIPENGVITVDTPYVVDTVAEKIDSQDENSLTYAVSLMEIPDDQRDRVYVARAYAKVKDGDSWKYIYSKTKISRSYVGVANVFYTDCNDKAIRARLDEMFEGAENYIGGETKTVTFSLFSDFHYYEGGYISSIANLNTILNKAEAANADFVMQAGDFCNDFPGSPELVKAYLENTRGLAVYGVYGNHDLENGGKMENVTSYLTNDPNVVWGTSDGKISSDGSIGYYYYEVNGFRIICTDTNYYYNTATEVWEHYPSWYSGPKVETYSNTNALGPTQLTWLEEVIMDAADKDIPCIVVTHASIAGNRGSSQSSDWAAVHEIFRKANDKKLGTVLMAINGHHHSNHTEIIDGVLYFDMNTTRNGAWYSDGAEHYLLDTQTFEYVAYDDNGNPSTATQKKVSELTNSNKTWFFTDPMSAIVHVSSNGRIIIEGMESSWLYGIDPKASGYSQDGEEPLVNSGIFNVAQH